MGSRLTELINYDNIRENDVEIRRKDFWLCEIAIPSLLKDYMTTDQLCIRMQECEPSFEEYTKVEEVVIRGFKVLQATRADGAPSSGTLSCTLQDRVDQKIAYFFEQWRNLIADRDALFGLPKTAYMTDIVCTYYDINQNPLRRFYLINAVYTSGGLPNVTAEADAGLEDPYNVEFTFEHYKPDWHI